MTLIEVTLGNTLGPFLSPALTRMYLSSSPVFNNYVPGAGAVQQLYSAVFQQLGSAVFAPFFVGQLLQFFYPKKTNWAMQKVSEPQGKVDRIVLSEQSGQCDVAACHLEHILFLFLLQSSRERFSPICHPRLFPQLRALRVLYILLAFSRKASSTPSLAVLATRILPLPKTGYHRTGEKRQYWRTINWGHVGTGIHSCCASPGYGPDCIIPSRTNPLWTNRGDITPTVGTG